MAALPDQSTDRASARALDCIRELLDLEAGASTRTQGLAILCRFGANVVGASAASHIRLQPDGVEACWCVWSAVSPTCPVLQRQREDPVPARQDWWTVSVTRRQVFDTLGPGCLAELPLRIDADAPSLLVLKRPEPFGDNDSDALTHCRATLVLIEDLIDRLFPLRTAAAESPSGYTVVLSAREHEVLKMLSEGLLARSIATRLGVSERTVHKHLGSLYRKLDVHDRLLAVRRAEVLGMLRAG